MFGSQILEVVIGLVLIYLALSIGCSGIKEVIAGALSLRATTLENAIRNMLKNGPNDYAAQVLAHPLITGTAPQGEKPSYISSRMFAAALLDVVAPANANQPRTIASLRAGVAQIPDTKLRGTLLNMIDTAGGDVNAAREKVAHWYDDTMARVSGWYKRMAQKIIFGAGLILCIAVNADTVMIVKELWNDQALRTAAVAQAEKRVQSTVPADPTDVKTSMQQIAGTIRETNAPPIGWSSEAGNVRALPESLGTILLKILGILLTSFAIVMGAPFWFDVLNNFINLRASGSPPPAAQ
ncbi:MAG TPA: hypothetical protein VE077_21410 [Candidatus Methylomirabilis sp.]|nr:hypothetical protein [Candidatus Methylomirabilis sp.]